MNQHEFVQRLIQLRLEKGVSARDMSLSLGQSPNYINNIETGTNLPSMSSFFYICEYFNITPAEFFDRDNLNPIQIRDICDNLKHLDKHQIDLVLELIKELGNKR